MKSIRSVLFFCLLLSASSVVQSSDDLAAHWSQSDPVSTVEIDHSGWDRILDTYLIEVQGLNYFKYSQVTAADRAALDAYLQMLQSVTVIDLSADEQFAYWVNFYNALTIWVVLEHYPIASIRNISYSLLSRGPWKEPLVQVEGRELSLDNIEHDILRPIYADPRIHYAVNCASIGCPNLQRRAFTRINLEQLLDQAAEQFINHPRGVRFEDGELIVSSIFDWYGRDFGNDEVQVIEHLREYADNELDARLESRDAIDDYEYNWDLNEPDNA